ncbi:MAG: XTP/dITP diphosphatase [Clostridia bacterium]|nr:XTP/dITP diphosphatase [Clostridia bacterium]
MKLIIATNNQKKLKEMRAILLKYFDSVQSLREAGIDHETVEDGTTFEENAIKKAREIAQISGCAAVADDSGLVVDALDGEPGIYSARYAGGHGDDIANLNLVLEKMQGKDQRSARFVCALAYVNGEETAVFRGEMEGEINHAPVGENGFGYDPIFFLPEYGCTSAEISPEEKNQISHRAKAIKQLAEYLER